MDFKIVFIDDNMSEKEPFVQNIRKHYKDADCNHVFQNPDKGLEFVLENLNQCCPKRFSIKTKKRK